MSGEDRRRGFWGFEWDFLALDSTGAIALLWSAGYGPIPSRILDEQFSVERAVAELTALPSLGSAIDRRAETDRSGDYSYWLGMSERGLYAYDWRVHSGPYQLVSAPTEPLHLAGLSPIVREAASLLVVDVLFANQSSLSLM